MKQVAATDCLLRKDGVFLLEFTSSARIIPDNLPGGNMSDAAVFVGAEPQLPVGGMTAFFLPLPDRFVKKAPR
ncbi:hypothetical protein LF934_15265 [Dickeya dadantii]|uniref:hypothetical protein n=1 Tax=Dickeya dadantii TaxID=204038 RepID=UPI001CF5DF63|nr:hypothetical protein [Dickeya dadantii]MCA7013993.1 hypothetical protein [Dickeya dadantii]